MNFVCKGGPWNGRAYACNGEPYNGKKMSVRRFSPSGELTEACYEMVQAPGSEALQGAPLWEWRFKSRTSQTMTVESDK